MTEERQHQQQQYDIWISCPHGAPSPWTATSRWRTNVLLLRSDWL